MVRKYCLHSNIETDEPFSPTPTAGSVVHISQWEICRSHLPQRLIGNVDNFPGVPCPVIRVVPVSRSPFGQRRFRIDTETAVTFIPDGRALGAFAFRGECAKGAVVFPCRLRFCHMLDVILVVMCGVFVEPGPHLLEFHECVLPFHRSTLQKRFVCCFYRTWWWVGRSWKTDCPIRFQQRLSKGSSLHSDLLYYTTS